MAISLVPDASVNTTGLVTAAAFYGDGSGLTNLSTVSVSSIADYSITNVKIATAAAIGATKIADGSVSDTEFGYLAGATSALQTQLNARVDFGGTAQQVTDAEYGLYVTTTSASGSAVRGQMVGTAGTSQNYGGLFLVSNSLGAGVYGIASASSGNVKGVHGKSGSTGGRGVYAESTATSGLNYGLYAETDSSAGYAGYFTGGLGVLVNGTLEASNVVVSGPIKTTVAEKSAAYTLTASDSVIFADANGGAVNVTLPAASAATVGRVYYVYKIDSNAATAVAVAADGSDTVNGGANVWTKTQWACIRVIGRDATSWVASTL